MNLFYCPHCKRYTYKKIEIKEYSEDKTLILGASCEDCSEIIERALIERTL